MKILIFTLVICFSANFSYAQTPEEAPKSDFWEHVRFGGGLGLSSGRNFFTFGISPSAIYQFNKKVSAGASLNYTYNSLKNSYKSSIYGGSLLGLFNPIDKIQISTEFEQLRVNRNYEGLNKELPSDNYWTPALFIGAGYRTNNVTIGLRYDVLYNKRKSVYPNAIAPFFRVFF